MNFDAFILQGVFQNFRISSPIPGTIRSAISIITMRGSPRRARRFTASRNSAAIFVDNSTPLAPPAHDGKSKRAGACPVAPNPAGYDRALLSSGVANDLRRPACETAK